MSYQFLFISNQNKRIFHPVSYHYYVTLNKSHVLGTIPNASCTNIEASADRQEKVMIDGKVKFHLEEQIIIW